MTYAHEIVVGEYLDKPGAMTIANRITRYWLDKGYPKFQCTIEPLNIPVGISQEYPKKMYCVRSNIGTGGWPPR